MNDERSTLNVERRIMYLSDETCNQSRFDPWPPFIILGSHDLPQARRLSDEAVLFSAVFYIAL